MQNGNSIVSNIDFSDNELELIVSRLWELLKKHSKKYAGCDSTSLRTEIVTNILESILYTISVTNEKNIPKNEYLYGNLDNIFDLGRSILKEKFNSAKIDYALLCKDLPKINNVYYLSTVKNIADFFKSYDIYYKAHEIPCSIDYWLLSPIDESYKGVSFIEEYITRLQIENDFINHFDYQQFPRLFNKYTFNYQESLFNFCDPIINNAIGKIIIHKPINDLNLTVPEINEISNKLNDLDIIETSEMVGYSITRVIHDCGINDINSLKYFQNTTTSVSSRIFEAQKNNNLSNIFLSF